MSQIIERVFGSSNSIRWTHHEPETAKAAPQWYELLSKCEDMLSFVGNTSRRYVSVLKTIRSNGYEVLDLSDEQHMLEALSKLEWLKTRKLWVAALRFVKKHVWGDTFVDFPKIRSHPKEKKVLERQQVSEIIEKLIEMDP